MFAIFIRKNLLNKIWNTSLLINVTVCKTVMMGGLPRSLTFNVPLRIGSDSLTATTFDSDIRSWLASQFREDGYELLIIPNQEETNVQWLLDSQLHVEVGCWITS